MSNTVESLPTRASARTDGEEPSPTPLTNTQGPRDGNENQNDANMPAPNQVVSNMDIIPGLTLIQDEQETPQDSPKDFTNDSGLPELSKQRKRHRTDDDSIDFFDEKEDNPDLMSLPLGSPWPPVVNTEEMNPSQTSTQYFAAETDEATERIHKKEKGKNTYVTLGPYTAPKNGGNKGKNGKTQFKRNRILEKYDELFNSVPDIKILENIWRGYEYRISGEGIQIN